DLSSPFQYAKDDCFVPSTPSTVSLSSSSKIRFISLNFALEYLVGLGKFMQYGISHTIKCMECRRITDASFSCSSSCANSKIKELDEGQPFYKINIDDVKPRVPEWSVIYFTILTPHIASCCDVIVSDLHEEQQTILFDLDCLHRNSNADVLLEIILENSMRSMFDTDDYVKIVSGNIFTIT